MDNFLKNNQDFTIRAEPKPKHLKPNRLKTVVSLCALVMVLNFSVASGATFATAWFMSLDFFPDKTASTHDPGNVTLINVEKPSDTLRSVSDEELSVINDGTLVINTNETELSPRELFRKVKDGVVGIEISYRIGGGRFSAVVEDAFLVGSGFVFTTDGYVLTNYHVIEDATSIYVVVEDYFEPSLIHRYEAEIVGSDRSTDLAVLKISRDEPFRALPIGDSSSLEVGAFVSPIGYPLGLEKSMTFGIVSGLNREFDDAGWELSSIQFDAAVNSGNSGGPLFDMYGNVVGIVNKKLVFENLVDNIGLAITIDEAKPIINDLLLYGEVTSRPMLGVSNLVPLNEFNAAIYGFTDITSGILVLAINPKAPAANSDLSVGDVIVAVNDAEIASVIDVQTQIRHFKPGDTVTLTVARQTEAGSTRRITIEIILASSTEIMG